MRHSYETLKRASKQKKSTRRAVEVHQKLCKVHMRNEIRTTQWCMGALHAEHDGPEQDCNFEIRRQQ